MASSSSTGKRKHADSSGDAAAGDKRGRKSKSLQQHAQLRGPGIFVSCVRGKERKAALELIVFLDDVADKLYPGVELEDRNIVGEEGEGEDSMDALRNGVAKTEQRTERGDDDIESQIKAELAGMPQKGGSNSQALERQVSRFTPVMTDMQCFFFVAVARPLDPVKVTYALLDQVKQTGQARSRYVHRLSPVCGTVYADLYNITAEADRVIAQHFARLDTPPAQTTFRVDVKTRLHAQLSKIDLVHALSKRMPDTCRAQLTGPDVVINVEVFRMTCGLSLLSHYDAYRRMNPLMLSEQWHAKCNDEAASAEVSNTSDAPSRIPAR